MDTFKICVFHKIAIIFILITWVPHVSCNVDIRQIAETFADDVESLKNDELGVPFVEKLFGNFKYITTNSQVSENVKQMAQNLETKINNVFSTLTNASSVLLDLPLTFIPFMEEDTDLTEILANSRLIDNNTLNDILGARYVLHQVIKNMNTLTNAVKQQYFISENDIQNLEYSPFSEYTEHDESIVWNNYMLRNKYEKRSIVLLLDHGGSLSKRQFNIVKSVAKEMLSVLNKTDRISVIGVASDWSTPSDFCLTVDNHTDFKEANSQNLLTINNFIDSLTRGIGATNHLVGIQKALEVALKDPELSKNETVMILYISRGLLSSLTEARSVLEIIAQYTDNIKTPLIINTCAVIDDSKSIMYETHFLRDIAEQNYTKYNIYSKRNSFRKTGFMLTVNKTNDISFAVLRFYSPFNSIEHFITGNQILLPKWDAVSNDLTVSFTHGWLGNNNSFVMLGVDIYFSSIAEDITYYSGNQQYSYAFLMDMTGLVLIHPSIPRTSVVNHQINFVDIKYIEKIWDIDKMRKRLLTEKEGVHVTQDHQHNVHYYSWSRVGEWYITVVKTNNHIPFNRPYKAHPSASVSKLLYQDLDGTEDYKLCRHLNQIATLDVASLYLSMSCFQSPFSASRTTQDKLIVQGYLAYLKDDTGLLINPGLKKEVRDEVSALAHVLDFLKKRHLSSNISRYIVRRYAASYSGVLQMFPGSVLKPGLETTKRPWFLRALQHKGNAVLIPPYLDKGGAGYIVTLSYATAQAVVAIDITYGYMFKMLLKHMPFCLNDKVTCFLIDDQGYIIYHPNLMDVNGARPVEQQHIVHRESLVANDILNHKHFISKLLCNNYGDSTIQRYYRLNTSYTDVLVNFVPGEHCVTYRITSVPNTNIFVGVVNASCNVVAAFCPCSIVDRLCLNCNRMEQKECECPCECPLEVETNSCQEPNHNNMTDNSPCMWYAESNSLDAYFTMDTESTLESCFPINCQAERSQLDCLGLLGCEWCRYDMDGNYLKKHFCSSITSCFNGVFGLSTPYRGDVGESSLPMDTEYSPVGPILGSVIAMCVLFILLFICYRSYTNPSVDRLYLSSTQDQLRMSDLNVNENYHDLGNHRDKLLKEDCPDPISPYCVASTYRRTNTAADSDHGYSTMTPHDESEHLSLAPVEVDSLEDDIMSDSTSVHTSISTKNTRPHVMSPMFTKIPNRNCVVVPVTVHRNMEAT